MGRAGARVWGVGLQRAALACATYAVAGKLATLMAIPPGYATAVWPAAGFALAFVMVWGPRVAPAIALGSFLVNIGTSLDTSSASAALRSVAVAGSIGVGAALQAYLGARLLRTRLPAPVVLEEARDLVIFSVLGGLLACVISPLVGVTSLCLAGVVPWAEAGFSAWTWWVGDIIGVLIFGPITLLALAPEVSWRRRVAVAVPLVVGFAAVTALFLRVSGWERDRLRTDFDNRARPLAQAVASSMLAHEALATSVVSLFDASEEVTREEFRAFTRRILAEHQGVLALSWNPVVRADDRAVFEAVSSRELPGFGIRDPGALEPAGPRPYYVPIRYFEPDDPRNANSYGLDVAAEPIRRETLERAASTGRASVTARVMLFQGLRGVVLFAPVLDHAELSTGEVDGAAPWWRPRAPAELRGFVAVVLSTEAVLPTAMRDLDASRLEIVLIDGDAPSGQTELARVGGAATDRSPLSWTSSFVMGGRPWTVAIRPTDVPRSWQAWLVLAGGLATVGVLGALMLMATGHAAQSLRLLDAQRRQTERLIRAEGERERLMAELTTLNAELEARVELRTRELTGLLREREVLLQEVHHRVGNNLQVVSSIIRLQLRKLDPGASRDALLECKQRVQTIALVHESLYKSNDFAQVRLTDFAKGLTDNVLRTMTQPERKVSLELDVDELMLAMDRAVPCGLLINELVSNALKHAFRDTTPGTIWVELKRRDEGLLRLSVRDDGVGLPDGLDLEAGRSTGLRLIRALGQQLGSQVEIGRRGGASFEVVFAIEAPPRARSSREANAPL